MTRPMGSSIGTTLLACMLALCVGCGGLGARPSPASSASSVSPASPSEDAYPGTLVDPGTLGPDFMWRQSVHATYQLPDHGEQSASFEVIVQKRDDTLTVVGMTPFGARAFVISQRGQRIELSRFVDEPLPVPPRFILVDIHRTFFGPRDDAHPATGRSEVLRDGERVTERFEAGRLVERRYERLDGEPAGQIVIDYGQGAGPTPPPVVTFDSAWFGYRLVITTLETTWL